MSTLLSTRDWSTFAHISGAAAQILLPSLGAIGPAIVWAIRRDDPVVASHAKRAVAFQMAMAVLAWLIGLIAASSIFFFFLGLLAFVPALCAVVCPVIAGVRVYAGEPWRYPVTDPLIAA